jgi:hypothetical protein
VLSVKPNIEDKVLDGHSSQKNLHALEYPKHHGVMMMYPQLQPLDVSFYGSLFYSREVSKWLKNHTGRTATLFHISKTFCVA